MDGTRKLDGRLLMISVVATLGACAYGHAWPPPAQPIDGENRSAAHCYTEGDVARIELMREEGRTLSEVVVVVGGTEAGVRAVEQRLRVRRRNALADRPAPPDVCPSLGSGAVARVARGE